MPPDVGASRGRLVCGTIRSSRSCAPVETPVAAPQGEPQGRCRTPAARPWRNPKPPRLRARIERHREQPFQPSRSENLVVDEHRDFAHEHSKNSNADARSNTVIASPGGFGPTYSGSARSGSSVSRRIAWRAASVGHSASMRVRAPASPKSCRNTTSSPWTCSKAARTRLRPRSKSESESFATRSP